MAEKDVWEYVRGTVMGEEGRGEWEEACLNDFAMEFTRIRRTKRTKRKGLAQALDGSMYDV